MDLYLSSHLLVTETPSLWVIQDAHTPSKSRATLKAGEEQPSLPTSVFYPLDFIMAKENPLEAVTSMALPFVCLMSSFKKM